MVWFQTHIHTLSLSLRARYCTCREKGLLYRGRTYGFLLRLAVMASTLLNYYLVIHLLEDSVLFVDLL